MRYVLIHGFKLRDGGASTTDRLVPFILEAGDVVDSDEADYGYWSLWKIIAFKGRARKDVLKRIAAAVEKADVVIGHSNGVNFGLQALNALPKKYKDTKIAIWISGAVACRAEVPEAVKAQLVLYTPHDKWVKMSSYIPFNRWGRQGARGYLGKSTQNLNQMVASIKEHSEWFVNGIVKSTWQYCYAFVTTNKEQ